MKPEEEWGPADHMAHGWAGLWGLLIVSCLSWGVGYKITEIAHDTFTAKESNKRGYINCRNGQLRMGNIDVNGDSSIDFEHICKEPRQ
jgi:hypothetical protein